MVAWVALILSVGGLSWQLYVWRRGRRFDVRVRAVEIGVGIPEGYRVQVIVTNHGERSEMLEEVVIGVPHRGGRSDEWDLPAWLQTGLINKHLDPRENVRWDFEVARFLDIFTLPERRDLQAEARFQTGRRVRSDVVAASPECIRMGLEVVSDDVPGVRPATAAARE